MSQSTAESRYLTMCIPVYIQMVQMLEIIIFLKAYEELTNIMCL